jgi:allophanate hydrolase subunit 2
MTDALLLVKAVMGRITVVDGGPRQGAGVVDGDVDGGCLAADDRALCLLNAVVGNAWWCPALEVLPGPWALQAVQPITVAVGGGLGLLTVDGHDVLPWTALSLDVGQVLRGGPCTIGLTRTIAIAGGVGLPPGTRLDRGAAIPLAMPSAALVAAPPTADDVAGHVKDMSVLRVVPGHERSRCGDGAWEALLSTSFTVSPQSSRQGTRLESATPLPMPRAPMTSMLTVPVWPGAVQVPPSGQPVILGADSTATGGYPRLAQLIAVDRFKLAQLRPGSLVTFAAVSLDDARGWHARFDGRFKP